MVDQKYEKRFLLLKDHILPAYETALLTSILLKLKKESYVL